MLDRRADIRQSHGDVKTRNVRGSCPKTTTFRRAGLRQTSPSWPSFLVLETSFKRRAQLARPSWLRLTRRPRGGITQQFHYLRDPPLASFEYSPQSAQCY